MSFSKDRPFIFGLINSYKEPLSEQYMQVQ